jgi:hypothetical protein
MADYYKPTSWGRTRRPKTLANRNAAVPVKETAVEVAVLAASSDLSDNLNSTTAGQNGYVTENQRYLHVYVKDAGTDAVNIYGYNYAFGKWAPVMEHNGAGGRSIMNAAALSGPAHYRFHIAGIDRVAFVKSSTDAPDDVFAACSHF